MGIPMEAQTLGSASFRCAGVLLALVGGACWGQTALSLSSGSGAPGGTVTLDLSFDDSAAQQVAGIQWSFAYPSSSITAVSVTAVPTLTTDGKSITCTGN